jgi:hypothetical protein
MIIEDSIRNQLVATFRPLNTVAAAKAFPAPTTLSKNLEKLIPQGGSTKRNIDQTVAMACTRFR